jgi:hypothetical protein
MALAVAGFAKVFVGEIIEKGKAKHFFSSLSSIAGIQRSKRVPLHSTGSHVRLERGRSHAT